jgi:hypothetical protein
MVTARLRAGVARVFDGMGRYVGVASVLCVLGVLAFLLEVQSPSWVQFSGIRVVGVTDHGLTYYRYDGQKYAIDNTHADVNTPRHPTVVWLNRGDPTDSTKAYINNRWNRYLDLAFVSGWFVLAAILVIGGFLQRAHRRRLRIKAAGRFGSGVSDEAVGRYLAQQRQAPRRRPLDDE